MKVITADKQQSPTSEPVLFLCNALKNGENCKQHCQLQRGIVLNILSVVKPSLFATHSLTLRLFWGSWLWEGECGPCFSPCTPAMQACSLRNWHHLTQVHQVKYICPRIGKWSYWHTRGDPWVSKCPNGTSGFLYSPGLPNLYNWLLVLVPWTPACFTYFPIGSTFPLNKQQIDDVCRQQQQQ